MPRASQNHDMGHQNVDCNQFLSSTSRWDDRCTSVHMLMYSLYQAGYSAFFFSSLRGLSGSPCDHHRRVPGTTVHDFEDSECMRA